MESRGYRNCNPGNIRRGEKWQGMAAVQNDPAFVVFRSMEYGYRAMCKVLRNYYTRYQLHTVRGIISRWAPANENHTESYIRTVSTRMGVAPDAVIDLNRGKTLVDLMSAISFVENGREPVREQIVNGIILANLR